MVATAASFSWFVLAALQGTMYSTTVYITVRLYLYRANMPLLEKWILLKFICWNTRRYHLQT